MSVYDDFEKFSHLDCYVNNDIESRCLPFKMNYMMFNSLCSLVRPLNKSEEYDKYILLSDLWSKMNSQIIYSRMSYDAHKEK